MRVREHREALARRTPILGWLFATFVLVVAAAYGYIQLHEGRYYRELADNNRLRREPIRAPRGEILDRQGYLLAESVPSYTLQLYRSRSADPKASLRFAARVLQRPLPELQQLVDQRTSNSEFQPVLLAENMSLEQVAKFRAVSLEHPEFEVVTRGVRFYRHGPLTAPILGYLGEVSEKELAQPGESYVAGDLVGRRGVERVYDRSLRGRDGEREVVVDSHGRARESFEREPATAGRTLQLTLDLRLQSRAERLLESRAGAIVAMDPRDGAIRALASSPSYDPNIFSQRLQRSEWQMLIDSPLHPLQNRAIQVAQSPGSVFKIVMAAAGLAEHVISPSDQVFCAGSKEFYGSRRRCWKAGGHGWVNLHKALVESCDIYFYELGQKLGIDRIAKYARLFGFGTATGIDLDGELNGNVPDGAWSRRTRGIPWYPGETISVAIGQGPLLTTPLQIAVMMAEVANGGLRVHPHVVGNATSDPPPVESGIDPAILARLRSDLWSVVNDHGTGANARVEGLDIAGKTGTVQVVRQATRIESADLPYDQRDHAWFASFAPAQDPKLVIVVYVEHGGKGSQAAAPLARELYEVYFGQRPGSGQRG